MFPVPRAAPMAAALLLAAAAPRLPSCRPGPLWPDQALSKEGTGLRKRKQKEGWGGGPGGNANAPVNVAMGVCQWHWMPEPLSTVGIDTCH